MGAENYHADVAVLGSGFGGSLCALILNKLGLRVVVIDRSAHPRFAIGESSTPIADLILRDLSDRYDLPRLKPLSAYGPWKTHYPALGVGRKRGFSYFHHEAGLPFRPDPAHGNELLLAASSDDYHCDTHWLRADVDAFFAEEVRGSGIPLLENSAAAVRKNPEGWLIKGERPEGAVRVSARFIVDATGNGGVLPQALSLHESPCTLRTHSRAVFSHFTGVKPWHELLETWGGRTDDHPFPCDAAALHHVFEGGWMWMLRFDSDLVSAGFALDTRRHPANPSLSPEAEWHYHLGRFPALQEQFARAELAPVPGQYISTGRLQRQVTRAAGAGWALLPFTAGFVDPLHSTGIAHTLSGVERLTTILGEHFASPSLPDALQAYGTAILQEIRMIDALVGLCYDSFAQFDLFSAGVMLYFAAVVTYEQERLQGGADFTSRSFLGADNPDLTDRIEQAYAALPSIRRKPDGGAIQAYRSLVEQLIAPYNPVGLFHPPKPNMYRHTAARG